MTNTTATYDVKVIEDDKKKIRILSSDDGASVNSKTKEDENSNSSSISGGNGGGDEGMSNPKEEERTKDGEGNGEGSTSVVEEKVITRKRKREENSSEEHLRLQVESLNSSCPAPIPDICKQIYKYLYKKKGDNTLVQVIDCDYINTTSIYGSFIWLHNRKADYVYVTPCSENVNDYIKYNRKYEVGLIINQQRVGKYIVKYVHLLMIQFVLKIELGILQSS